MSLDDVECEVAIRSTVPSSGATRVHHFRRSGSGPSEEHRQLIGEAPLVIELIGHGRYTIMRTPGDDVALAAGFLLTEGLVSEREDIAEISGCAAKSDVVRVRFREDRIPPPGEVRNLVVNSSCGLCGREGLDQLIRTLRPVSSPFDLVVHRLYDVPAAVRKRQRLFEATGGCHAAALFDSEGRVHDVREDLGRHSALDKILGAAWLDGRPLVGHGVFLSGRSSLEMIVKAARAGVSLVTAVSAPSSAAVEAADRLGITLCGFVRGDEVAVYTHPSRIVSGGTS